MMWAKIGLSGPLLVHVGLPISNEDVLQAVTPEIEISLEMLPFVFVT